MRDGGVYIIPRFLISFMLVLLYIHARPNCFERISIKRGLLCVYVNI